MLGSERKALVRGFQTWPQNCVWVIFDQHFGKKPQSGLFNFSGILVTFSLPIRKGVDQKDFSILTQTSLHLDLEYVPRWLF